MKRVLPLLLAAASVAAAPSSRWQQQVAMQNDALRQEITALKAELIGIETDLKKLEGGLQNQNEILDSLQDDVERDRKEQKELLSKGSKSKEEKFSAQLEKLASYVNKQTERSDKLEMQVNSLAKSLDVVLKALGVEETQSSRGVHVVQSGDSLGRIAVKYKTNIATLKKLNDLKNDRILIGQKIKLP